MYKFDKQLMGIRTQTHSMISLASNSNALLFPKHSVFLLWASIQYFLFIASKQFVVFQSFKSYLTLCKPKDCSTPSSSVLHYLPEFAHIHVPWVDDAIQPSHCSVTPFSSCPRFLAALGFFPQWINSLPEVSTVLELQLQHQYFRGLTFNVREDLNSFQQITVREKELARKILVLASTSLNSSQTKSLRIFISPVTTHIT